MAKVQFDSLIIHSEDKGVLVAIYGKGVGLYQLLKKHPYWDTIAEDFSDLEVDIPDTLEELVTFASQSFWDQNWLLLRNQILFY